VWSLQDGRGCDRRVFVDTDRTRMHRRDVELRPGDTTRLEGYEDDTAIPTRTRCSSEA